MLANSGAGLVIVEATARRAPRPHHPRLPRALLRRQRGGAGARRSPIAAATAPPSSASSSRMPAARPRRSGHGRAAARSKPAQDPWQTIAPSAIPFGADWHVAARDDGGRHRAGARGLRRLRPSARCASASTPSSCTTRTAICALVPVADLEPAHRPVRRLAGEPHAVSASRSRARCARWCRRHCRSARASPAATGARAASLRMTRWPIAKALKADGLDYIDMSSGGITADTRNPTAAPATTCRSPRGSSARPASPPAWSG